MASYSGYTLIADYHTHTVHSHGRGTIAENAQAAAARGLVEIAITDHGPALASGAGLRNPGAMEHIRSQVEAVNAAHGDGGIGGGRGLAVLQGVEANVMSRDGDLDLPDEVLSRLDIVLAGLHPAAGRDGIWGSVMGYWEHAILPHLSARIGRRQLENATKALTETAIRRPVDIIVHPGMRMAVNAADLARAAAQHGVALEINSSHGKLDVASCRAAAKQGCFFAVDSDAHSPGRVGDLGLGAHIARQARVDPERIVNTGLCGARTGGAGRGWGGRRS